MPILGTALAHHLCEEPVGDMGMVLKESIGLCASELGSASLQNQAAIVRAK